MGKWYAVRRGRVTGILESWPECRKSVTGFPGAQFKSFKSLEEARTYLETGEVSASGPQKFYAVRGKGVYPSWKACQEAIVGVSSPQYRVFGTRGEAEAWMRGEDYWGNLVQESLKQGYLPAFTDGSFMMNRKIYGWGVVLIPRDDRTEILSGCGGRAEYCTMRNVSGEVYGALAAMLWAREHGWRGVHILHDYEGLSRWADGEWKAVSPISRMYRETLEGFRKEGLQLRFTHVKAHSGIRWNELADKAAKEAAEWGEEEESGETLRKLGEIREMGKQGALNP